MILRSLHRCRFFHFFHCTHQIHALFMIRRLCAPAYSNSANREQCACEHSQGGEGHVRDRTCHDGAGSFIIETGRRAIVPGAVRRLSAAAVASMAPSVSFALLGARLFAFATVFCRDSVITGIRCCRRVITGIRCFRRRRWKWTLALSLCRGHDVVSIVTKLVSQW